jgi:thiamine biosynthesis lipoprotein
MGTNNSGADSVQLACEAMAVRFELVLSGSDAVMLRSAGEEALAEIRRIEARISPFRPSSEIAQVNACAAHGPVPVSPGVFDLLRLSQRLGRETGGAFDITVGPLMRCWRFRGGTEVVPGEAELTAARLCCGTQALELDEAGRTVRFSREGVTLDLGAIGKGWAIDRAVELLREAGVTNALLHGGTSTVFGLGSPPGRDGWPVSVARSSAFGGWAPVVLRDCALSVSDRQGRTVTLDGRQRGHIMDPRTGRPVEGASMAAVVADTAAESDALSTALLVLGEAGRMQLEQARPGIRTMVQG